MLKYARYCETQVLGFVSLLHFWGLESTWPSTFHTVNLKYYFSFTIIVKARYQSSINQTAKKTPWRDSSERVQNTSDIQYYSRKGNGQAKNLDLEIRILCHLTRGIVAQWWHHHLFSAHKTENCFIWLIQDIPFAEARNKTSAFIFLTGILIHGLFDDRIISGA